MKANITLDGTLWITAENTTEIYTLIAWGKNQRKIHKIPKKDRFFGNIDINIDIGTYQYIEK